MAPNGPTPRGGARRITSWARHESPPAFRRSTDKHRRLASQRLRNSSLRALGSSVRATPSTQKENELGAVRITVALSRERREQAPDESLPPASCECRPRMQRRRMREPARSLVRRSPAAAQCYTARRTRPPHRRQTFPNGSGVRVAQAAHDARGAEPARCPRWRDRRPAPPGGPTMRTGVRRVRHPHGWSHNQRSQQPVKSPAPRFNASWSHLVARDCLGSAKRHGLTKLKNESRAVCITVALSRERRERAPDESLPRVLHERRSECSGVKKFEHARPLVRRSTAAAQCYTALRMRLPHRLKRWPSIPMSGSPQAGARLEQPQVTPASPSSLTVNRVQWLGATSGRAPNHVPGTPRTTTGVRRSTKTHRRPASSANRSSSLRARGPGVRATRSTKRKTSWAPSV
jgi:hypothetical protein